MTAFKDNQQQRPSVQRDQLITIGDLIEFKTSLLQDIAAMLKSNIGAPAKKWLKSKEVIQLLEISAGKLQYLRDNGTIPFTKLGGITYYDYAEIEELMASGKHKVNLKIAA